MDDLIHSFYEQYEAIPPGLRQQSVWRINPSVAKTLTTEFGQALYTGVLILGRPVTISAEYEGFYLDGRPNRPRNARPKRRA